MKLTDNEHVLVLIAAGVTPQTAAAQVELMKQVERDFAARLCKNLYEIPQSALELVKTKETFVEKMSSYIRGHL